jgi:hypothetical protein
LYSTSTPTNTKTTQPYPTQREAKEEGAKTVAADDPASYTENAASAIAVARALNASEAFTNVSAYATATRLTGAGVVTGGTLNDTDYLSVNGSQITGFVVQANDDRRDHAVLDHRLDEPLELVAIQQRKHVRCRMDDEVADGLPLHLTPPSWPPHGPRFCAPTPRGGS